jgi:hypothetical protein
VYIDSQLTTVIISDRKIIILTCFTVVSVSLVHVSFCIAEKMKINGKNVRGHTFYLGVYDFNLDRTFATCPDYRPVDDSLWGYPEPDNYNGNEACVVVDLVNKKGFLDEYCPSESRYACQVGQIS